MKIITLLVIMFLFVGCEGFHKEREKNGRQTKKIGELAYIQVGDTMDVEYFREILDISYANEWTTTFIHSGWDYTYITINNKTKVINLIRRK